MLSFEDIVEAPLGKLCGVPGSAAGRETWSAGRPELRSACDPLRCAVRCPGGSPAGTVAVDQGEVPG